MSATCHGCGVAIPPSKGGRPRKWCSERCRKNTTYGGICAECGGPTPYGGRLEPSRRCLYCEQSRNAERNARIVAAWNEGEPEWYIAEREGLTVAQVRGAIQQARKRGEHVELHRQRNRTDWPEIERLYRDGLTGPEIAERIGDTARGVYGKIKSMRAAGVDLPYRRRRSHA